MKKGIAIFASGSGSNAQALMDYFAQNSKGEVRLLVSNNPDAYALQRAQMAGVPTLVIDRQGFYKDYNALLFKLKEFEIDAIVLAGFLWLVPEWLLNEWPEKVVNIHPALLPAFGGKGMHGLNVHKAVKDSGVTETGITIHLCNKEYDKGAVLFQAKCPVHAFDSPEDIARRVLELEHRHFAPTIESWLESKIIPWEIPQ